jgi:hypothetical protein
MSLRINSDFNGVTDPDAGRYIAAVEAADGNQLLEFGVGKAINDFVVGCKQDRIWDAIKASCILAGARTLSGALVPLAGTAPTPVSFVSGDYNRKTGLVGDGSTKYLNSNRNNNADPQDSKHVAVKLESFTPSGSFNNIFGALGSNATGRTDIGYTVGSSELNFNCNSSTAVGGSIGQPSGFLGVNRSAAATGQYRQGGVTTSTSSASQTPANASIHLFARIFNGSVSQYALCRMSFYSIGESLDLALLDARVTALITAFGVAIP